MADLNQNIYGTLARFKAKYAKAYLIRLGSTEDTEPADFDADINNRLTEALKAASDKMDGYIMGKHNTPVNPYPDFFENDCYCITIGILIRNRGYEPDTADAKAVEDADKCEKKYVSLAEGKWDFNVPDAEGETGARIRFETDAPTKIFSETELNKIP